MTSADVSGGLEYDTIAAPLDVCCGVFDQLARLDGPVPPMAQLGNAMLFMVRPGSAAPACESLRTGCAALGIEFCDSASRPDTNVPDPRSWVVPLRDHGADLPSASAVVEAIRAAYAATHSAGGTL